MMQITKKDLQKISKDFRTIASRFLGTDFESAIDDLKRFMSYIKSTPLIMKFLESHLKKDFDIEHIINTREWRAHFDIPLNESEEISFVYQLLDYTALHYTRNLDYYHVIADGYGYSNKFNDHIQGFNRKVVLPFINYIQNYFEDIMIDSGMNEDSTATYQFNFNGNFSGQFNHAQDQAKIEATMNVNPAIQEITSSLERIISKLNNENSSQEVASLVELVEALKEEINTNKPKKLNLGLYIDKINLLLKLGVVASQTISLITLNIDKITALFELIKIGV